MLREASLYSSAVPFSLSPEQQETVALLERLLGKTIANRYVDFTRLAESATGLKVSRPMAAHALRELESMIRTSLEVPMDAKAGANEEDEKKLAVALIRAVLKNGIQSGNAETIQRTQDIIGIFATFGETSYLDLAIRPH